MTTRIKTRKKVMEGFLEHAITLQQAADMLGVTRARVRQIVHHEYPDWPWLEMKIGDTIVISKDSVSDFKHSDTWGRRSQS